MALPHLLLVDDSEAILAFEAAALSSHYQITTAANGREALDKLSRARPDAMVLDLSMPIMDGDELFRLMRADPVLADVPVIVASSERDRAQALLKEGARAYLPKPIRADELLRTVNRVLDEVRWERRARSVAILPLTAGPAELAFPLELVKLVLDQPATQAVPSGRAWLRETVTVHGEVMPVLQLALRLGLDPAVPLPERKLVVVEHEDRKLAVCVDRIGDPEELPESRLVPRSRLEADGSHHLPDALLAFVHRAQGVVPLMRPTALLSGVAWRSLSALVEKARAQIPEEGGP